PCTIARARSLGGAAKSCIALARLSRGQCGKDRRARRDDSRLDSELNQQLVRRVHLFDTTRGVAAAALDETVEERLADDGRDLSLQPPDLARCLGSIQALEHGGGEPFHEDRAQELAGGRVAGDVRYDLDGHAEGCQYACECARTI